MVPGTIAAPTGYAVNVTLYYFNHAEQNDGDNDGICHVIALIEEHIEGINALRLCLDNIVQNT